MDPSSYANLDHIRTYHYDLVLTADFEGHVLTGLVHVSARALQNDVSLLVLDSKNLVVEKILEGDSSLKYTIGENSEKFGQSLTIHLKKPLNKDDQVKVTIFYSTSSNASAIQWLKPQQTKGLLYPFMFTQCQAIHARSMIPCQDSPAAKSTYSAHLKVPGSLVALMSAESVGETVNQDGTKTFSFQQHIPIPSYLIAIAIGDMCSRPIGPRSKVWTENNNELADAAALDFSETEKFLSIAEEICGPYIWGKYDILMLPPSFPYGGMENPMLTFVTPSLLTGDKSNADVVAHEISHSWTGNLVSNLNWEHFWLNEGFTMFIERKITAKLHGNALAHLSMALGWQNLKDDVTLFSKTNPELTKLVVDLNGVDPDDAFSTVPYEKGFNFLFYLESIIGEHHFSDLLKEWLSTYAKKTVTSENWKNLFLNFSKSRKDIDSKKVDSIDWDTWLYAPGMPPVTPTFDCTLEEACTKLVEKWKNGGATVTSTDITGWSPLQIQVFLDKLREEDPLPYLVVEKMDKIYSFSNSSNMEITFRFFQIAIKSEYSPILENVLKFITSIGRMKYVRPLYRALYASKMGKEAAVANFVKNRSFYHAIAANMVAKDLEIHS